MDMSRFAPRLLAASALLILVSHVTAAVTLYASAHVDDAPPDQGGFPEMKLFNDSDAKQPDLAQSDVLVLDASNFTQALTEHPFVVVEFYAPWCGYCKRFAPEYEEAASMLKTDMPSIVLAKVDATVEINEDLANRFDIESIPTLKIFENSGSTVREYEGPRHADGIVGYLRKQAGPPSEEITNAVEGQKLVDENDFLIVGIFSSYDSEEFKNFTAIASELRTVYEFRHTLDASFLPAPYSPINAPVIFVFKKFDDGYDELKDFTMERIRKFLDEVSIPFVVEFKKDPIQSRFLSKIFDRPSDSKVFLLVDANSENSDIISAFSGLAKAYRGKGMRYIIADSEDGLSALEFYGAKKQKLPSIVIEDGYEKKFMLENAEVNNVEQFLEEFLNGNLTEHYKSEPVPEKNDEPVKIVVLDTFDEIVLKSGKNVLVEFYAPWCSYCLRLAPILDEVAISLQTEPDVLIAKYDATANDVSDERFDVTGFPTLYLHSATGKLILYEGRLNKDDLIKFIIENKDSTAEVGTIMEPVDQAIAANDEL